MAAGKAAKGAMGSLVGLGVGGAAYYATAKVGPSVPFLAQRWYAAPLALALVGHIAKRWSPESGQAVVGAAGALFAFSYYVNKNGTMTVTPSATTTTTTTPATSGLSGYYSTPGLQSSAGSINQGEAGRSYGDAGALMRGRRAAGALMGRSEAGLLVT
jgi:hypothetical protein